MLRHPPECAQGPPLVALGEPVLNGRRLRRDLLLSFEKKNLDNINAMNPPGYFPHSLYSGVFSSIVWREMFLTRQLLTKYDLFALGVLSARE